MNKVLLLCGLSCVGKTQGGKILARDLGFTHVEASSVMRMFWQESDRTAPIDAFAERSLLDDPARIPSHIIERARFAGIRSLVVTGLRAPREVDTFASAYRSSQLIVVDASFSVRLKRALARGRAGHPRDAVDLLESDRRQKRMGVAQVAALPWASHITNEGTLLEFASKLRLLIGSHGT